MTEPALPTPPEPIPPQIRFREVRDELLRLERAAQSGAAVDTDLVRNLVREAADLIAQIQTSSTGPKKKTPTIADGDKPAKTPRAKKAPSSPANLINLDF